jgi:hypothetical protein
MFPIERIPHAMAEKYAAITALADAFCAKQLNEEYRVLIHRVVANLADNFLVWMLQVNGLMIDIRQAPAELQRLAYEKGLIPFIPAERSGTDA